jgi:NapH/MauN family ferredoxin-type protein
MKLRVRKIQILRRAAQVGALIVLLAIPAMSRYNNYLAARELDKYLERWDGTPQGEALAMLDAGFRMLPGAETERVGQTVRDRTQVLEYAQQFRGGPWSAEVAGVSLTDPLAAAESIAARRRVARVLVIGLIIPVVGTLLLGRIFCSWICPMGLILELTDKLRTVLRFLEIRPRDMRFSPLTKHMLLAVGLAGAAISAVPVLAYIYPPAIISREAHDLVFGFFDRAEAGVPGFSAGGLTWMSLIIVAIVLFEVLISRRWWCRYVCPGGALYGILGALRPVRVKLAEQTCTKCGECVNVCPMGLNPMQNRMGIDCDNCGVCVSDCPDGALNYRLAVGAGKALQRARTKASARARLGQAG